MTTHRLDPSVETVHWGYFDAKLPARIEVESGDTIVVDTVSGWREVGADESRLRPSHRDIVTRLKPQLGAHILTGPVAVRGAEPGDTLEVRIQSVRGHVHSVGLLGSITMAHPRNTRQRNARQRNARHLAQHRLSIRRTATKRGCP